MPNLQLFTEMVVVGAYGIVVLWTMLIVFKGGHGLLTILESAANGVGRVATGAAVLLLAYGLGAVTEIVSYEVSAPVHSCAIREAYWVVGEAAVAAANKDDGGLGAATGGAEAEDEAQLGEATPSTGTSDEPKSDRARVDMDKLSLADFVDAATGDVTEELHVWAGDPSKDAERCHIAGQFAAAPPLSVVPLLYNYWFDTPQSDHGLRRWVSHLHDARAGGATWGKGHLDRLLVLLRVSEGLMMWSFLHAAICLFGSFKYPQRPNMPAELLAANGTEEE